MRKSLIVSGIALATLGFACGDASTPGASKKTTTTVQAPSGSSQGGTVQGSVTGSGSGSVQGSGSASATGSGSGSSGSQASGSVQNNTTTTVGSTTASSVAPAAGTASPALRTPYRTPTAQPSMVTGTREFVCENIWSGVQCDLSQVPALGANQAYLAHGDVAGNGRCGVMVWTSGKPSGLAAGTWKLYRLHGPSTAHLDDGVAVEQEIAAAGLQGGCPVVN